MTIDRSLALLVSGLLCFGSAALHAAPFEDPARIHAAAFDLLSRDRSSAQPEDIAVDAQLRLPACPDAALTAGWVREGTIEVGCASDGWRLFVPVRATRRQTVLVLARAIAAGQPIGESDLLVEQREGVHAGASALADPAAIAGRVARRTLSAGSVLGSGDLQTARSVRRGDEVTLIARHGSIEVRARGRALADGGENDIMRVENLQSRRIVSGMVRPSGEVEILR